MLSREIIQKIKRVQLHARFLVRDAFAGEYQSSFKGQGMEFEEVREYVPGDDVRNIDWNVSARMQSLFIKKYREERELTMFILVDMSASAAFGTTSQFKREMAAELAAAIAYCAIEHNDKVGVILFSDKIEKYIAPQKGRNHVFRIIREILAENVMNKGTNLNAALQFLMQIASRRATVFLLSDFLDSGYEKNLTICAKKHELIAISIRDKMEYTLPAVGLMQFEDLETGQQTYVDTSDKSVREKFKALGEAQNLAQINLFKKAKVDNLIMENEKDYIDKLVLFLRKRRRIHAFLSVVLCLLVGNAGKVLAQMLQMTPDLQSPMSSLGSAAVQNPSPEIADIKPLISEPYPYLRLSLILLAIFIILGLVGYFLYKKYKSKPERQKPVFVPPPEPAHVKALRLLQALPVPTELDSLDPEATREKVAPFYFSISEIFKGYLEDRFYINATDLTTEELSLSLDKNQEVASILGSEGIYSIRNFLRQGDLVKFARFSSKEKEMLELKNFAISFVSKISTIEEK